MALALFGSGVGATAGLAQRRDHGARRARRRSSSLIYIISPPGRARPSAKRSPESTSAVEFGVFLGLIELIALTFGGYMTMQEEGASFGGAADRLSGPGGRPAASSTSSSRQPPPAQQPPHQHAAAPAARRRRSQPPRRAASAAAATAAAAAAAAAASAAGG